MTDQNSNQKDDEKEIVGKPVYLCTLCGAKTVRLDVSVTPKVLTMFYDNPKTVTMIRDVPRFFIHPCNDGGFGMAHITGLYPEDMIQEYEEEAEEGDGEGGMVN